MNRPNHFTFIHKAIRAALFDAAGLVARTDFGDAGERATATGRVRALLSLLDEHAENEDRVVFPDLAAIAPELATALEEEHFAMEERQERIRDLVEQLSAGQVVDAAAHAGELGRQLSLLVADQLRHMDREETEANAFFWAHRTDAELAELNGRIQSAIPPVRKMEVARLMFPALSTPERAQLLAGARAQLPGPAFAAMAAVAQSVLGRECWLAAARAAGLDVGRTAADA